jgi:hypothetical protein
VQSTVDAFQRSARLTVIIPPEGDSIQSHALEKPGSTTLPKAPACRSRWGFLDFKRKRASVERLFEVTGDIEADMVKIQAFYAHITGKNPRQF